LELPATSWEVVGDCLAVIDNLELLINQLDGELHQYARADPRVKMLTSLPGVGEFSALLMLTGIGNIERFGDTRELARWARLIPTARGPELPTGHRHIPGQSQALLRWVCCQAAQTAIRSPAFAATYAANAERRGKKIATIMVARKLLARAWHLLASMQAPDTSTAAVSNVAPPLKP
jgi:transposase